MSVATKEHPPMTIRRLRAAAAALALLCASLLSTSPVSADDVRTTPMQPAFPVQIDTCHDHGAYLGTGLHRFAGGQNLAVVEVCGDPARHTVRRVVATYLKVDGTRAGG